MIGTEKKVILVVDDEPELRDIISDECRLAGHEVYEAENAEKALLVFQKHKIDLVLSDVRMPGGDGVALLKGIKSQITTQKLPRIFMMSGFSDYSEEDLKKLGAEALVNKPFDVLKFLKDI
jgi:CheY-like chemotaxis protein